MFSNSQITLLVLRTHPRNKLLLILLHNLANGRVLRVCQNKKSSNRPCPVPQKTSNSPRPVTHQKNSVNRGSGAAYYPQ
jgi:hypothetical protein